MFKDIIFKMVLWNYLEKAREAPQQHRLGLAGPIHHGAPQPRTHRKPGLSPSPAASCNLSFFFPQSTTSAKRQGRSWLIPMQLQVRHQLSSSANELVKTVLSIDLSTLLASRQQRSSHSITERS